MTRLLSLGNLFLVLAVTSILFQPSESRAIRRNSRTAEQLAKRWVKRGRNFLDRLLTELHSLENHESGERRSKEQEYMGLVGKRSQTGNVTEMLAQASHILMMEASNTYCEAISKNNNDPTTCPSLEDTQGLMPSIQSVETLRDAAKLHSTAMQLRHTIDSYAKLTLDLTSRTPSCRSVTSRCTSVCGCSCLGETRSPEKHLDCDLRNAVRVIGSLITQLERDNTSLRNNRNLELESPTTSELRDWQEFRQLHAPEMVIYGEKQSKNMHEAVIS